MTGEIYLQEAGILIVVNEMAIAPALLVILAAKIQNTDPFSTDFRTGRFSSSG